jgi:hypothetical protein
MSAGGWKRYAISVAWWATVAWALSLGTNRNYAATLAVILAIATLAVLVVLAWLTRWAMDDSAKLSQWTLGVALSATLFVAACLGASRWLWLTSEPPGAPSPPTTPPEMLERMIIGTVVSLVLAFLSVIPLFWFAEGLVWSAAWVVRRPSIQRLIRRCPRHPTKPPTKHPE